MPIPAKLTVDFKEETIYHIYNRTNNFEKLFLDDNNRRFFLKRYKEILSPFLDTYCWNLLPNHFHLLVRTKSKDTIVSYLHNKHQQNLTATEQRFLATNSDNQNEKATRCSSFPMKDGSHTILENSDNTIITLSELIEQAFKRFFQSYALAFNKQQGRKGNLFYKPFKRVKVKTDHQFTAAIIYINTNAAKHQLVKDFMHHPWTSWHTLTSNRPTSLLREEIINWFGTFELYVKAHKEYSEEYYNHEVEIED